MNIAPLRYDRWLKMAAGHGAQIMMNCNRSQVGMPLAPHVRDGWCKYARCYPVSLAEALSFLSKNFVEGPNGGS